MEVNNNSIGETLRGIRRGDIRRQVVYNEETGEFFVKLQDIPLEEGMQNVTDFAEEGYA